MYFVDIKKPDSVGSRSEEAHAAGHFHPLHLHHISLHHDCLGPALAWEGSMQGKVHGEVGNMEECQALLPTPLFRQHAQAPLGAGARGAGSAYSGARASV